MKQHIAETDLALYVSGDLRLVNRLSVHLHQRGCEPCRRRIEAYRADRERVKDIAAEMPEGVDWDRLAMEMSANIRVGLAAGECVARPSRDRRHGDRNPIMMSWRAAAMAAGVVMLLSIGWLLNMPSGTTQELGRAMSAIVHGHGHVADYDRGPVVIATPLGVELRENDSELGGSQDLRDSRPVAVSVSLRGSASARTMNADTGQMTITSVYVQ
jgi:anti-sigma factor RsiW